jgi:23S rRNA pseudouridine2605 synthase
MRLQKAMAWAGVASRRASDRLILQGRVCVNGEVVTEMGLQVDPARDRITVDGEAIEIAPQRQYLKLHKPTGYLTVFHDDRGRPDLGDLVPHLQSVHPVGRLDLDSEGLVLLTDDGALTQRLTHPRYEHDKEYLVLVRGAPDEEVLKRLGEGITLQDGPTAPAQVSRLGAVAWGAAPPGSSYLRFVLHEGRKRQIRRMCAAVGHPVERLIRVRIGPIELGDLAPGAYRHLTPTELARLRAQVDWPTGEWPSSGHRQQGNE